MKLHLSHLIAIILFMGTVTTTVYADEPVPAPTPDLSGPELSFILNAYSNLYLAEQLDTDWNGTPAVSSNPKIAAAARADAAIFKGSIEKFRDEMKDPTFDDETVRGVIAKLKQSGYAYVRQKGAACALTFVISEAGDLAVIGFSILTGNMALLAFVTVVPFQTGFMVGYVGISQLMALGKNSAAFGSVQNRFRFMSEIRKANRKLHQDNGDLYVPMDSAEESGGMSTIARVSNRGLIHNFLTLVHLKKPTLNIKSLTRLINNNDWMDDSVQAILDQNTDKQIKTVELLDYLEKTHPENLNEILKEAFPNSILVAPHLRNSGLVAWGLSLVKLTTSDKSEGLKTFYGALDAIPEDTSPTVFMQFWANSILPYLATQGPLIPFKQFRKLEKCFKRVEGAFCTPCCVGERRTRYIQELCALGD